MVDTAKQTASTAKADDDETGKGGLRDLAKAEISPRLIEHVEVTVDAVLGDCRITVADLSALASGDVLPLDRQINEAVEIRVNGKVVGHGEIVTVDDKFAVRITAMG